jgi:hypothetical protein
VLHHRGRGPVAGERVIFKAVNEVVREGEEFFLLNAQAVKEVDAECDRATA